MTHPLFWRFSKWGWVTLIISGGIGIIAGFFGWCLWSHLIQAQPLLVFFIALEVVAFGYVVLGIRRILTWKERLNHYLSLKQIVIKKGFDPILTLLCRNTCDQEIIKQLKEDLNSRK